MTLSSYQKLPCVPLRQVERIFCLGDVNVEITSLDIASHGSFVVAGTSSGLILLFDLSNPHSQQDGLLIGQIRARGMHTNLILTVKFSEDSRFVFAGVSKGSSEMLAIDLGRVLVQWEKHPFVTTSDGGDSVQQLQLKNLITFNYSDAKLRGFGAVSRTMCSKTSPTNGMFESSTLYRLACGKGIKNVHIWHFSVGYPIVVDGDKTQERHLHGKWEYVCDVASNGNTITHVEFRSGGNELLSKSAGMCVRMWNLDSGEALPSASNTKHEQETGKFESANIVESTIAVPSLKATYADVANSQDVKCLLPLGTVAYGGTYQFAVVNTAAPKEANRDVLELPERYSGDGMAASTSLSGNIASLAGSSASSGTLFANRGRRITREIEQVMCTNDGQQALVMCADGGVVYYSASVPFLAEEKNNMHFEEEQSTQGCGGCLLELHGLFRLKDQQQHLGSWTLRRVGRQGLVVLLRAHSTAGGADVTIECKLLSSLLPKGGLRSALEREDPIATCETQQQVDRFYVDPLFHPEQVEARRSWVQAIPVPKKSVDTGKGHVKRVKIPSRVSLSESGTAGSESSVPQLSTARKRKAGSVPLMDNSPVGVTEMTTPATISSIDRHQNESSPYEDATSRLTCTETEKEGFIDSHTNSSLTTEVAPIAVIPLRSSGRSRVPSSSFAKLRALRDDVSDDEVVSEKPELLKTGTSLNNLPLHIPSAPKVRRTSVKPLSLRNTAGSICDVTGLAAMDFTNQAVSNIMNDWLNRYDKTGEVLLGRLGLPTLGACAMQRLSTIVTEQDRLKELFVQEVKLVLTARASTDGDFEQIIGKYAGVVEEMVQQQQLDFQGACAADSIVSLLNSNLQLLGEVSGGCCERKVVFRHDLLFGTAHNMLQSLITLRKCV